MKNGMTLFGCGPKLALICLPYILLSIVIMFKYPEFLSFRTLHILPVKIFGVLWGLIGLVFWINSAIYFINNLKPGVLLTSGPFSLCRDPIYSAIIVLILPAIGLILHSGLILTIPVVLYIGFKMTIQGEKIILKRIFGKDYYKHEKSVIEIFPLPSILRCKRIV
jgi:protein-S-isoprenylcysteine O-methyltransferase Ste14